VRELVTLLEQTVVNTLAEYGLNRIPRADAPGVYVGEQKICSWVCVSVKVVHSTVWR
jgi:lipoyl(octanoyl) transferase